MTEATLRSISQHDSINATAHYESLWDRQTGVFLEAKKERACFSAQQIMNATRYLLGSHISPNETSRICPWDAAASTAPRVKPDFEKAYSHESAWACTS